MKVIKLSQEYSIKELAVSEQFGELLPINWEIRSRTEAYDVELNTALLSRYNATTLKANFITTIPLYMNYLDLREMGKVNGVRITPNQLLPAGEYTFLLEAEPSTPDVGNLFSIGFLKIPFDPLEENNINWAVHFYTGGTEPESLQADNPDSLILGAHEIFAKIVEQGEYIPLEGFDEDNNLWSPEYNASDSELFNRLFEYAKTSMEVKFPQRFFVTGVTNLTSLLGKLPRAIGIVRNPEAL